VVDVPRGFLVFREWAEGRSIDEEDSGTLADMGQLKLEVGTGRGQDRHAD
jgi:hypothetical protein